MCLECGKQIKNSGKFCSRSCSAKYNNRLRVKNGKDLCTCGRKKDYRAETCKRCLNHSRCIAWLDQPLSRLMNSGSSAQYKFNEVRTHARKMMKYFGPEYKCSLCDFSVVLHVDHIKELSEFGSDTLIGEANGLQNLRYLCPNHHAMKDKGLL